MPSITGWIFDTKRFAVHDGPGIRTTAFFQGCPLHCPWCHNPESVPLIRRGRPVPPGARQLTAAELISRVERDRVFFEESGGGVTFSGGDPLSQPRFLDALLADCRERSLHTALDTCGHAPPQKALPLLLRADLVLFDIKFFFSRDLLRHCGATDRYIFTNLEQLMAGRSRLWLRFPLIPGYTDTPDNLSALRDRVRAWADRIERVSILPFHPAAAHKYRRLQIRNPMREVPSLPEASVLALANRLKEVHPQVRIGG
ncbi:MAG TPA: radical SAM protein [Candidatus Aminicenantes bacterium]|nr:radical SAM protein [Candidatus Aminicenantes bacterium]